MFLYMEGALSRCDFLIRTCASSPFHIVSSYHCSCSSKAKARERNCSLLPDKADRGCALWYCMAATHDLGDRGRCAMTHGYLPSTSRQGKPHASGESASGGYALLRFAGILPDMVKCIKSVSHFSTSWTGSRY